MALSTCLPTTRNWLILRYGSWFLALNLATGELEEWQFPDAASLATARAAGADLLTENTKDFAGRDPLVRVLTVQDLNR